jgi:hypothetical protein
VSAPSNNKLTYAYGSACIVDEDGTVGGVGRSKRCFEGGV